VIVLDPDDTDNDGLPDAWEIANFGDLSQGPNDDTDDDGISNIDEYYAGSDPASFRPDAPDLSSPEDDATDVPLTPELNTGAFSDPDGDAHVLTRWQISTDENFDDDEQLVLDFESDEDLTLLEVFEFILDPDGEYFWRAQFTDSTDRVSEWSDINSFTTDPTDRPDPTEPCAGLFGDEEVPPDTDCVDSEDGTGMLGMQAGANVASVDGFSWIDPADIPDALAGVSNIEVMMGLMSFKVTVIDPTQPLRITFHFSEALPEDVKCWKWYPDTGWYDYSAQIVDISGDRMSMTMEYQDGVLGDLDKLINGVVIDPAAVGAAPAGGGVAPGGGGGGSGGCFISSASDTLPAMGKAAVLMLLLGFGITGFVGFNREQRKQ